MDYTAWSSILFRCQYTDNQSAGNVLCLAVYIFSHKNLRSKIEQNVVISLLS